MTEYTSKRYIDGKVRHVIVDETGNIVNKNPGKDELKGLEKEPRFFRDTVNSKIYTDDELLDYIRQFYEENGRPPSQNDFANNPAYPSYSTYFRRLGNWSNILKIVGMDLDTRVMQGCLKTEIEKSRYAEIKVINHFKQHSIDMAGENRNNPCDGICPNGKTYDVKSSKLIEYKYYLFNTNNKHREEIEIYYFLAFNEDYSKLEYAWRVPGEIVEKDHFYLGKYTGKFNVENMKEFEITDKFKDIIEIL